MYNFVYLSTYTPQQTMQFKKKKVMKKKKVDSFLDFVSMQEFSCVNLLLIFGPRS